jgi:hypothetical protein
MKVNRLHTGSQSAQGMLVQLQADIARLAERTARQLERADPRPQDRQRMEQALASLKATLNTVQTLVATRGDSEE